MLADALILLAPASMELEIVEIGHLPFYNQDIEDHPPVEWTTFRERVKATNAVLFVTPEYNRSVPAVLHRLGSARLTMDERSFAVLKQISASEPEDRRLTLRECKELVREQYLMLRLDEGRALAAIPKLLGADGTANLLAARDIVRRTVASYGTPEGAAAMRLARIEALFKAATAVVPRIGEPRRIGEASSIAAVTRREGRSRESGEPSAAWAEGDGRKHDPRR